MLWLTRGVFRKTELRTDMEKIKTSLHVQFAFALAWSVLMVVGVPMIVFGAAAPDWLPLPTLFLVLGIAFSGGGFYGVPLLWISYGAKRELYGLVYAVEVLGLRDVASLSSHLRKTEEEVRAKLDVCLAKGYLPALVRRGDRLENPLPVSKPEEEWHDVICSRCGAHYTYKGTRGACPYCGVADHTEQAGH